MKASSIDSEIQTIDREIATLTAVRERLEKVRGAGDEPDAPKVKRTRRKKGLPSATPPASEANLLKDGRL